MEDTIIAPATPQGAGAIGVIRLSGKNAIKLVNNVFNGKNLEKQKSHTIHFGTLRDGGKLLDEVLVSLFIAPKSFTGENVVEISCHGSNYIIRQIIQLFIRYGARPARAGEFTLRAFLNNKMDLSQAEAVADLIHADSEAAHHTALHQMRGGFSGKIKKLREELIHFASMIELELDFGEEEVEFADRNALQQLVNRLLEVIKTLIHSFDLGNVLKNGVPVVIAGKPNAGKSTLLNALLHEEKAIVSDIPGTTRDFIEDELIIDGISFRFIDTAGLRETTDAIESIGVARTHTKMKQAALILYLFDLTDGETAAMDKEIDQLKNTGVPFLKLGNKLDKVAPAQVEALRAQHPDMVFLSAKAPAQVEELKVHLLQLAAPDKSKHGDTVVTNVRHYNALLQTKHALQAVRKGIDSGITNDFVALDIRQALHYLGEITGEITTDDLLANIFSKFCIGK